MKLKVGNETSQALEKLLAEARSEADELRKRVDKFERILLSTRLIMGHELKKPTTAITGYLDLAMDDIEEGHGAHITEHVLKARNECELLNELNLFFLELLKVENRPEVLHGAQITIRGFVNEILQHMPEGTGALDRVKSRISPDVQKFHLNPSAFKIILTNLIENALHYSSSDVLVTIRKDPDKRGMQSRDLLKIKVIDEGGGIPKEALTRIFRPFVRLSDDNEGTGLGLTLVRSLVELNGGSIHIRSEEGEGTTVSVMIPEILESMSSGR